MGRLTGPRTTCAPRATRSTRSSSRVPSRSSARRRTGQRRAHGPLEPGAAVRLAAPSIRSTRRRASVLGVNAYPSLADAGHRRSGRHRHPGDHRPRLIGECVAPPASLARSSSRAGFREIGRGGRRSWKQQVLEEARRGSMRIVGPELPRRDEPGHRPERDLRQRQCAAPGSRRLHQPERRALHRHSRLELRREASGFSAFVSLGSMLDVGWGDLIDYLGDDRTPRHRHLHGVDRRCALVPVRRARSRPDQADHRHQGGPHAEAAAKAAASHTGSLTGSDEVLDAAFRRGGVLRVNTIAELFYMAEVLAKQPRPAGPRLTIRDQRRRPRRARHRRAHRQRRAIGRALGRGHGAAQRSPARRLEPRQPDRYPRRRGAGPLRARRRDRGRRPEQRRHARRS